MARLPGFGDIHPLQPQSTVQGAIQLMEMLAGYLLELTGMHSVAMSPKAGAHGELCGMLAIKAAHEAKGSKRSVVLVPESAHGTNPATAAFMGYSVKSIPARADGTVLVEAVKAALGPDVAAIMLTNPNTCGLFEPEVVEIAQAVHDAGAYFYCDGANFNAIVGKVRPGDFGVDAMHINLHKTFSTPHGGGGPGSGPVVLSAAPLAPLLSRAATVRLPSRPPRTAPSRSAASPLSRPMGMYVWPDLHAGLRLDGMRRSRGCGAQRQLHPRRPADVFAAFGDKPCMHEVLFDDTWLKDTGVTTLDFAKAMIDEGYHPMTMYFPLVVHGAMLIEPTESESKASLDLFIAALRDLAKSAKSGDVERFKQAPRLVPRRRLDETKAAREPRLTWKPDPERKVAAE
jgi:glycine dehydrogenase subunit 2